ncbi:hypothetical protein OH77DRAFT_1259857 [Trametes cingulata]|nr:hypothetical protein OH77DRAFT_1259857 [Trametes cingulata]
MTNNPIQGHSTSGACSSRYAYDSEYCTASHRISRIRTQGSPEHAVLTTYILISKIGPCAARCTSIVRISTLTARPRRNADVVGAVIAAQRRIHTVYGFQRTRSDTRVETRAPSAPGAEVRILQSRAGLAHGTQAVCVRVTFMHAYPRFGPDRRGVWSYGAIQGARRGASSGASMVVYSCVRPDARRYRFGDWRALREGRRGTISSVRDAGQRRRSSRATASRRARPGQASVRREKVAKYRRSPFAYTSYVT